MANHKTDFTNIKCCICEKGNLTSTTARREYDTNGNWTKRWFCNSCRGRYYKYGTADKEKISQIYLNYQKSQKVRYNNRTECEKIIKVGFSWQICENNFHGKAFAEKDDNGNSTGKWICRKCYNRYMTNKADSHKNIQKALRDTRLGTLDPNSNKAKGDRFEELTCRWRSTVSTIPVENLNKKLDRYNSPIDHSRDSELGILQTKGKIFDNDIGLYGGWIFGYKKNIEKTKEYDIMICYCTNKDGKIIERIYLFPKEDVIKRNGISITRDPTKGIQWYEKYRIKDEYILINVNKIWKDIINESNIL